MSLRTSSFFFSAALRSAALHSKHRAMIEPKYVLVALLASLAGLTSHLGYFIHGEHHMQSLQWLLAAFSSPLLVSLALLALDVASSYGEVAKLTTVIVASFFASLVSSIVIYRVLFHPLRRFPGPFAAKLTKLSHVWRLRGTSDNYLQAHRLHATFGDIVRCVVNVWLG